jgi:hypothetical protein
MRTLLFSFTSASGTNLNRFNLLLHSLIELLFPRLERLLDMSLSPLRRIVSRTLEVYEYHRTGQPRLFVINDTLECGHIFPCLGWDIFDLLDPYIQNPQVSAKRHHCRPCAQLLATRKPVQSVGIAAKVGVV